MARDECGGVEEGLDSVETSDEHEDISDATVVDDLKVIKGTGADNEDKTVGGYNDNDHAEYDDQDSSYPEADAVVWRHVCRFNFSNKKKSIPENLLTTKPTTEQKFKMGRKTFNQLFNIGILHKDGTIKASSNVIIDEKD